MILNKLISVIIPVYNVRPYIVEALDSVRFQTYEKLEIIIIDDGSTDSTKQLVEKWQKEACSPEEAKKHIEQINTHSRSCRYADIFFCLTPGRYADIM